MYAPGFNHLKLWGLSICVTIFSAKADGTFLPDEVGKWVQASSGANLRWISVPCKGGVKDSDQLNSTEN